MNKYCRWCRRASCGRSTGSTRCGRGTSRRCRSRPPTPSTRWCTQKWVSDIMTNSVAVCHLNSLYFMVFKRRKEILRKVQQKYLSLFITFKAAVLTFQLQCFWQILIIKNSEKVEKCILKGWWECNIRLIANLFNFSVDVWNERKWLDFVSEKNITFAKHRKQFENIQFLLSAIWWA